VTVDLLRRICQALDLEPAEVIDPPMTAPQESADDRKAVVARPGRATRLVNITFIMGDRRERRLSGFGRCPDSTKLIATLALSACAKMLSADAPR
jgi:hypothetical protein